MISLARFSIRRPKASLVAWLIVGVALSVIGLGAAHTLSPWVTVVPGTQSSRAQQLANAQFGPAQLVPILLEGRSSNSTVRARSSWPRWPADHTRACCRHGMRARRARGFDPDRLPR
jgi:hypothetical protein